MEWSNKLPHEREVEPSLQAAAEVVFGARSSSEISLGSGAQRRALVPIMTVRPPRLRETILVPMWVLNSTDKPPFNTLTLSSRRVNKARAHEAMLYASDLLTREAARS